MSLRVSLINLIKLTHVTNKSLNQSVEQNIQNTNDCFNIVKLELLDSNVS